MTKRQYFGTDGVRGRANTPPMDAETLLKLAKATCLKFKNGKTRHKVVIGKDTRLSGYMVEPALTSGFISMGWGRINDGSRAGILRCCDHNMVGQSMFDVFAINKG